MGDTGKISTGVRQNYTKAGITQTSQMNRIGREINLLSMSQDLTKTPTGYKYTTDSIGASYSFQVVKDTTYTPSSTERKVAIRGGLWDIGFSNTGGTYVASLPINPAAAGANFVGTGGTPSNLATSSATIAAGETKYIALFIKSTEDGNISQAPGSGTLEAAYFATRPEEDNQGDPWQVESIKVLAMVVNTAGKLTITQEWTGGNIKTLALVPDGADGLHTASGEIKNSLFYGDFNRLEMSGFSALTNAADDGKVSSVRLF